METLEMLNKDLQSEETLLLEQDGLLDTKLELMTELSHSLWLLVEMLTSHQELSTQMDLDIPKMFLKKTSLLQEHSLEKMILLPELLDVLMELQLV